MKTIRSRTGGLICAAILAVILVGLPGCERPVIEIYYSIHGGFTPLYQDFDIDKEGLATYEEGHFGEPQFVISDTVPEARHWALYKLFLSVGFFGFEDSYPWTPSDPLDLPMAEITLVDHVLGVRKTVSFYMWPEGRPDGLWKVKSALDSVIEDVKAAKLFTYELMPGSRVYGASCPPCDDYHDEELSGTFTLVAVPSPIPEVRLYEIIRLNFYSPHTYSVANNWEEFSRIEADFMDPVATMTADVFVNGYYEEWVSGRGELVEGDPAPEAFVFEGVGCSWVQMDLFAVRVD